MLSSDYQTEYTHFNVHPLIAFEHYISTLNHTGKEDYPRFELFENSYEFGMVPKAAYFANPKTFIKRPVADVKRDDIPNYDELKVMVDQTVNHFRSEIAVRKIIGKHVSPWMESVAHALNDMDRKRLHSDHMLAVCKLVPFYKYDKDLFDTASDLNLSSFKEEETFTTNFKNLRFIKKVYPKSAKKKGSTEYMFATRTNHMMLINVHDAGFCSSIDTILQLNDNKISIDTYVNSRIMYSNDFGYLTGRNIIKVEA